MGTTRHLEEFSLYTPKSLLVRQVDPSQQLIRREYNSMGFYGVVQMVNYLATRNRPGPAARLARGNTQAEAVARAAHKRLSFQWWQGISCLCILQGSKG